VELNLGFQSVRPATNSQVMAWPQIFSFHYLENLKIWKSVYCILNELLSLLTKRVPKMFYPLIRLVVGVEGR
jgi:hypothetical protein